MKVIVTGATGFLGGVVVSALVEKGHEVVAMGRDRSKASALIALGAEFVAADLREPIPQDRAMEGCDGIVHCAALSSPWGPLSAFVDSNVRGTKNVIELGKALGVAKFVHISTTSVYFDYHDRLDLDESAEVADPPPSNYTKSKLIAEAEVVAQSDMHWIILRPRGLFGPGDAAIVPRALRVARRGWFPMVRGGEALVDLTYVDNVADAVLDSLESPLSAWDQVYNISNGDPISVKDFFGELMSGLSMNPRLIHLPLGLALFLGSCMELLCSLPGFKREPLLTRYTAGLLGVSQTLNIGKARFLLGYAPRVSVSEGLNRVIEFERGRMHEG